MLYREQFEGCIGRTVELDFPSGDGTLAKVTRAVPQNLNTLRDLAEQLFIIPEGVLPAFPEGVASQHLLGAFMMDDTAVLNLSREGAELFAGLDADRGARRASFQHCQYPRPDTHRAFPVRSSSWREGAFVRWPM